MGPYLTMVRSKTPRQAGAVGGDHLFRVSPICVGLCRDSTTAAQSTLLEKNIRNMESSMEHTRTVIGSGTLLMVGCHVAHNCEVGDRAILANGVQLAGYVTVGSGAFLSGGVLVHQFIRIGRLALLRGGSRTSRDVPPFAIMDGTHSLRTINRVGLRRAGFSREMIDAIGRFYREYLLGGVIDRDRVSSVDRKFPEIGEIVDFVLSSRRGICFPPKRSLASAQEISAEEE